MMIDQGAKPQVSFAPLAFQQLNTPVDERGKVVPFQKTLSQKSQISQIASYFLLFILVSQFQ